MAYAEPVTDQLPEQEWDTYRVLTLPNVLSFIRLLGVPVFGWLILTSHDVLAVVLLAVFGATDWFDGWIARTFHQRSPLGAKLDPVADRLYILIAVVALTVRCIVPWWLTAALLLRDLMLIALVPSLSRSGRNALPVNFVGKSATMALLLAFPLVLVGSGHSLGIEWALWIGWVLAIIGTVLYWWAGFIYLQQTIALSRERRREIP